MNYDERIPGEVRPGVDARNLGEALKVARYFAKKLELEPVEGESLAGLEKRVWIAFHARGRYVRASELGFPSSKGDFGIHLHVDCRKFEEAWELFEGSETLLVSPPKKKPSAGDTAAPNAAVEASQTSEVPAPDPKAKGQTLRV